MVDEIGKCPINRVILARNVEAMTLLELCILLYELLKLLLVWLQSFINFFLKLLYFCSFIFICLCLLKQLVPQLLYLGSLLQDSAAEFVIIFGRILHDRACLAQLLFEIGYFLIQFLNYVIQIVELAV